MSKDLSQNIKLKQLQEKTDLSDGRSIERYAMHLEGMTFRDVLDLDIHPEGGKEHDYSNPNYKGGMGTLLEERYFGYESNSDERPDFADAGVELKTTCYKVTKKTNRKTGDNISAGERLVITMIPLNEPISENFFKSHLWEKCQQILLVYYERDRNIDKLDQQIKYVKLFTPPADDLEIIQMDYEQIASYIQAGRADELSEGLTIYLGACTKGTTAEKSWVEQYYPRVDENGNEVHVPAKKRAFAFKRSYMDYVLHTYILKERAEAERILSEGDLEQKTFEEHVKDLVAPYVGRTDVDLCKQFGVSYKIGGKNNNSVWTTLSYRMLGIKNNRAEEFLKAGISVRAVRIEENGKIKESLSLAPFEFMDLACEDWEDSELRTYLDGTKFFFVVYKKVPGEEIYALQGSCFWNMPVKDIEGPAHDCWARTRKTIKEGVKLNQRFNKDGTPRLSKKGKLSYSNNLPKERENRCMHVRPHTGDSFYDFGNGRIVGEKRSNASELPDGRWMTKQSFWFNNSYIRQVLEAALDEE